MNKSNPEKLDTNLRLWKYLDLSKLLSIFEENGIYFQSPLLFDDPFEATFHTDSIPDFIDSIMQTFDQSKKENNDLVNNLVALFGKSGTKEFFTDVYDQVAKSVLVSCWHLSEYESEAMWQLYAKNNQGIALVTTVGQLHDILPEGLGDIYPVHYIDYNQVGKG
jgi:hypothetical protein